MAWVVNVTIDPDKTNVGTASAVFTDTDGSTFTATARATLIAANATSFVSQAIAARNAWQTRKTSEANDRTVLINDFTGSVPTEAASASQVNSGSITLSLAS